VRRLFDLLIRNWPLKLGAIVLASVLYAGLVLGQNARVWPVQVPIQILNQPAATFDLTGAQYVTSIRLYAAPDVASQLTSSDFTATVDLADVTAKVGATPVIVPVEVVAHDPRVTVLDYSPRQISIRLDPIITRQVPVQVDRGTIPSGLTIGAPTLDVSTVTVRGGSTLVKKVADAVARVRIDPSGINVDGEVDLVAVDARGDQVSPVDLTPSSVHVRIQVSRVSATRSLPVTPTVTGSPATGYQVDSVTVQPTVVTVSGDPSAIGSLDAIATAPISVNGKTSDVSASVDLAPPTGVSIVGSSSASVTIGISAQTGSQTFQVGLSLSGAAADRSYGLSASSITVTLGGSLSTLGAIDGATLVATVNVTGLAPGNHVVPVVFTLPTGTRLDAITPSSVTVTVGVPASPSPSPSPTTAP
jgi:YbbR domain-containing protein